MKPEEIRQLLGGYASGTLSEAEQKLLFEASLHDQALFDALADEQALKDLLDDPESRGYLQAVLDEEPSTPADITVPAQSMAAPAPAAPPHIMRKRSVEPIPAPPPKPAPKGPAMWWGLAAAAALAAVSVVGIIRLTEPKSPVEVAVNSPAPKPVEAAPTERAPTEQKKAAVAVPESKPIASATPAASKTSAADKAVEPRAPEAPRKEVETSDAPKLEAQKPRDSEPVAVAGRLTPPQQAAAPPPPPPPPPAIERAQQSQAQSAPAPSVAQNQADSLGPRQMFLESETAALDKDTKAKKVAAGAMGGAAPALARMRSNTSAAFAMRYKLMRRISGQPNFVAVAPGSLFRIGDELVLEIEKNSSGVARIMRLDDTSLAPVPLALQTANIARSVPLKITGPLELAIVLNRSGGSRTPSTIPPQPADQRTEVADGMVYVAEPAAEATQPLVVRVSIRIQN